MDHDNEEIFGKEVWANVRPLLRSGLVFFHIISAFLYWTLTIEDHPTEKLIRERMRREKARINLNRRIRGLSELMAKLATVDHVTIEGFRNCEQYLQILRYGDSIRYSLKLVTPGQVWLSDLMYMFSFPALLIILVPPFTYLYLLHHEGKEFPDADYKFTVDLTLDSLITCLCGVLLMALPNWSPPETDRSSILESFAQRKIRPFSERVISWFTSKVWLFNAEAMSIIVFGLASVMFCITSVTEMESKVEVVTSIFGIVSTVTQLITILVIKFRGKRHRRLARSHSTLISVCLGFLFCVSLSSLIVTIIREDTDKTVHHDPLLRTLMPFLVDFRVHAVILNFSMATEFIQHRYPEGLEYRDLRRTGTVELERSGNCYCAMFGCGRQIFVAPEYHVACSEENCDKVYCSECNDVVISQLGMCVCALCSLTN
jgi:hypothetical protein